MSKFLSGLGAGTLVLVFIAMVAIVIFYPFIIIWAINTLFGLNIDFTFLNWVAGWLLIGMFKFQNIKSFK